MLEHHSNFAEGKDLEKVTQVIGPIVQKFLDEEVGQVYLFYNEFKTALTSELKKVQLLPLSLDTKEEEIATSNYFFEPSEEAIVDQLVKEYINISFYRAILESKAAEEGARMAAMDSATDNASDMIKGLTLLYNRTRQAQITTELSEIVAGAEALVA